VSTVDYYQEKARRKEGIYRTYFSPKDIPVDNPDDYWIGQPLDGLNVRGEKRPFYRVIQIHSDHITVIWTPEP